MRLHASHTNCNNLWVVGRQYLFMTSIKVPNWGCPSLSCHIVGEVCSPTNVIGLSEVFEQ